MAVNTNPRPIEEFSMSSRAHSLKRTSDFLGGAGSLGRRSGLPAFWQIAHDVRSFLLSSHKEATTTMVVEARSPKKPIRRSTCSEGLGALAGMGQNAR